MKRLALAGTALTAALVAWPQAAGASGDYGCAPSRTLGLSAYECAGTAVIGPRNDTRMNLAWLLRDRAGIAAPGKLAYPKQDWETSGFGHVFLTWDTMQAAFWPRPGEDAAEGSGEDYAGSRCQTLASGGAAFRAALDGAKGLGTGEHDKLAAARDLVKPACDGDKGAVTWPAGITSRPGLDFLAYLQGARAFYADDFATAKARFSELAGAKDPWLAETARYMIARNALAAAQANAFDEWGSYEGGTKVDKGAAARGQDALDDYLKAFPQGRYAGSATGLRRRAVWLLGDGSALSRIYAGTLVRQSPLAPEMPALMEEIDSKLLFGTGVGNSPDAPVLLATWDFMRMRSVDPELAGSMPAPLTAAQIDGQRQVFAKEPALYGFLQASHAYHVARDYRRVLALIPDDARAKSFTPLAFSRQMLRGLALEKLGDRNAAGFWEQLGKGAQDLYQRPAVELALAMNRERAGALGQVFAPGSAVAEPEIRTILLAQVAGPELLRLQAGARAASRVEREVALMTLLAKSLSRGRYAEFGQSLALVPKDAPTEGWLGSGWVGEWMGASAEARPPVGLFARGRWQEDYPCPALARTAATLAASPEDVRARLCLGEFYRLNGLDDYLGGTEKPAADQLGGTADLFPGKASPRATLYAGVLATRGAAPDDVAYALYRSVMCYAPSGNNACGGTEVPEAQRKAWFQRLKREYPKSKWASDLKYFW